MARLWRTLYNSRITCPVSETQFLPLGLMRNTITEEVVKREVPLWFFKALFLPDSVPNWVACKAFRVFAILILIDIKEAIRDLVEDQITDDHLPLQVDHGDGDGDGGILVSNSARRSFKFLSTKSWSDAKRQDFIDTQWTVLAPLFSTIGQHISLDHRCPLPFVPGGGKVWVKVGDAGTNRVVVYHAQIERSHRIEAFEHYKHIAVKEFKDQISFEKEASNLEQVQQLNNRHLIKLLGSCERGSAYYLIFQWANGGDLRSFWENRDGLPRTKKLLLWILQQNLGIIGALRDLHNSKLRHGDIKPHNIFLFQFEDGADIESGLLVIGDFGISRFHTQATVNRVGGTNTAEVTVLYEAPEAESDRQLNRPRSRKYDIWSLGCMLLEFIVWFVYKFEAVESFRRRRNASSRDPTTAPGNFFIQPEAGVIELHSQVLEAIAHLRQDSRCQEDRALGALITLIQQRLLRTDPADRAEASEVYDKFKQIVDTACADPSYLFRSDEPGHDTPDFFKSTNASLPIQLPPTPLSSSSSLETTFTRDPRNSVGSIQSSVSSSSREC
ncbi:kinase-like domain-containing protein [Cercophora samala]|uniref:Kinase-like domain-containing protein n=1 Tax=Cercophora samala TaxID=330535 RepID=A0AA39ZDV2_9PEZI|nr:kinase-like domain-containing protein [Cercophora samala]